VRCRYGSIAILAVTVTRWQSHSELRVSPLGILDPQNGSFAVTCVGLLILGRISSFYWVLHRDLPFWNGYRVVVWWRLHTLVRHIIRLAEVCGMAIGGTRGFRLGIYRLANQENSPESMGLTVRSKTPIMCRWPGRRWHDRNHDLQRIRGIFQLFSNTPPAQISLILICVEYTMVRVVRNYSNRVRHLWPAHRCRSIHWLLHHETLLNFWKEPFDRGVKYWVRPVGSQ